jgi:hypothetical protein
MSEENVKVIFNSSGGILIQLGDAAIALDRVEAEQLFVDLGHALQDQDMMYKAEGDLP